MTKNDNLNLIHSFPPNVSTDAHVRAKKLAAAAVVEIKEAKAAQQAAAANNVNRNRFNTIKECERVLLRTDVLHFQPLKKILNRIGQTENDKKLSAMPERPAQDREPKFSARVFWLKWRPLAENDCHCAEYHQLLRQIISHWVKLYQIILNYTE